MNGKNIERIIEQLTSVGLPAGIESDLMENICLQPDNFQISYRHLKDTDTMNCIFYFEREESEYDCRYYEALLRKKISLPSIVLNEVDVNELQDRMRVIDWNTVLANKPVEKTQLDTLTWERAEAIETIVTDLRKLTATQEGLQFSESLKIKFWIDTPLFSFIPNINTLRNKYEVSQRFYFFEGEAQISLDEAYRFLCHRWREKQLNAKKKQSENTDASENVYGSVSGMKGNKLLLKKKNNKGKHNKIT